MLGLKQRFEGKHSGACEEKADVGSVCTEVFLVEFSEDVLWG